MNYTVLLAPMKGFYLISNIGKTQVRLALVEDPESFKNNSQNNCVFI